MVIVWCALKVSNGVKPLSLFMRSIIHQACVISENGYRDRNEIISCDSVKMVL